MYGSTEGTVGLINTANKVGAVGYLPRSFLFSMLPQILPITIIKLDENRIDLVFEVNEGPLIKIDSISFFGNKEFSHFYNINSTI